MGVSVPLVSGGAEEREVVEAELDALTATLSEQVEKYNAISRAFLKILTNLRNQRRRETTPPKPKEKPSRMR